MVEAPARDTRANIRRLDIAVQDAVFMSVGQRVGHVIHNADDLVEWQRRVGQYPF
jgi:hypothetical protein